MSRMWSFTTALMVATAALGCSGPVHIGDVSYDDRFGNSTTMDIWLPEGATEPRPAVMMIHGGAWRWGDKGHYSNAGERLAKAGYVAASINYRLVPAGQYPAAVQDCVCALSFLRAHADDYGIDPGRIAVMGYSAGGHLSSLLGVATEDPMHEPDCEWGPTGPPAAVIPAGHTHDMRMGSHSWITDFMGGTKTQIPELYDRASPIVHVRPDLPPYLIIHGQDDIVDIAGAEAMVDALDTAGNDVSFLVLENAGHITSPSDSGQFYVQAATDMPEAWLATIDFLDRTLGGPP